MSNTSKCANCGQAFKSGEKLQAFLRSPDNEAGYWTDPVIVDDLFQDRAKFNGNNIKRRHYNECT